MVLFTEDEEAYDLSIGTDIGDFEWT